MKHTLPALRYSYGSLEPHIDARTMEIHHTKHHQAYIDKLNGVLDKHPDIADQPLEYLMEHLEHLTIPESDKITLRNNGGGHLNHSLFWRVMGPQKEVDNTLADRITKAFGTLDEFKEVFTANALGQFGSGWSWLVEDKDGNLKAYATPNQDSPYLVGDKPLFGIDVWEHAYYLNYQNKRPDYVEAWWNVLKLIP